MGEQPSPAASSQANIEEARKFLITNRFIHFALILGLVMFGGVALFITIRQISYTPSFSNPVNMVAVLGCIATIGLSFLISPIYLRITAAPANIRSALQKYQAFCMIRWAVIEGGALFSGVAILVTKDILPICLYAISVAFLISRYPSQKEFIAISDARRG